MNEEFEKDAKALASFVLAMRFRDTHVGSARKMAEVLMKPESHAKLIEIANKVMAAKPDEVPA